MYAHTDKTRTLARARTRSPNTDTCNDEQSLR